MVVRYFSTRICASAAIVLSRISFAVSPRIADKISSHPAIPSGILFKPVSKFLYRIN